MKRTHNPTDINHQHGQELTKKLYRSITEQAKRLDDARSCARNIGDLFSTNLIIQRKKFCEYCERLIFADAVLYGRRGEELLWRKGFYDVVSTAKKLKKNEYSPYEITSIQAHINCGIGYYHHLLLRIQREYHLDLKTVTDFTLNDNSETANDIKPAALEWAKQSVHQCLTYLGDLSRYKLEIYPNWEPTLAIRYYLQAVNYRPEHGMPHNQMGTLEMNQNHNLEAVYHYIRCLSCKFPFEGTTNNLQSLFEKNSTFIEGLPTEDKDADCIIELEKPEILKRFLARFLLLIDIWYFNKKVSKVYNLCHQIYKNFEECLSYSKPTVSESGDSPLDSESLSSDTSNSYLSSNNIFKIVVICLICISKLRETNSPQLSIAISFTLAIYSQLVQNVSNHIQESVQNYPLNKNLKSGKHGAGSILSDLMNGGKKKSKLRRRKIVKIDSEEESEASDNNDEDYSSSDDSFISDNEDVLAVSSDEESDIIKVSGESDSGTPKESLPNGLNNGIKQTSNESVDTLKRNIINKVQQMDFNDMLEIISEETTLQSIKILNDWLKNEPEILMSCGINTRNIFSQITHLLNLININSVNTKVAGIHLKLSEIVHKEGKIPLTEDVVLKGVQMLDNAADNLDWNYIRKRGLTNKEETIVRIVKLLCFGKYLTTLEETGVKFNETDNMLICNMNEKNQMDDKLSAAILDELEMNDTENISPTKINGTTTTSSNNAATLSSRKSSPANALTDDHHNSVGHRLTKMWLASEVKALENRIGNGGGGLGYGGGVGGGGKATLSPYLVLDADALIRHTSAVKQLVYSRKFVVIVPSAVVSALDDLKRERIEAREAIRWLESQFHRGNRFFRAQRPQERAAIPFIKYPKKKDKEMHIYIQIIECCHFLAEQQKGASNVVTLLIGNQNVLSNGENKEFSYVGLAQSVGISIEPITNFYGKWKTSKCKR